jgi:hypothetical protein
MKRSEHLECPKCDIVTSRKKWAWVWYRAKARKLAELDLWLCPECAGEIGSDAACDSFLARVAADRATKARR